MSDELRAAAERLRKSRAGHPEALVYGVDPQDPYAYTKLTAAIVSDIRKTSDAYLAEHQADDAEPVTAEGLTDTILWLRAVFPDGKYKTRGDVRRLCAAIGVPLKESGDA